MINNSKKLTGPFLIDLKNKFREIAGEDQLIDINEFRDGLELANHKISDRLFTIFDKDGNGVIDLDEFLAGIEQIKVQKQIKVQRTEDEGEELTSSENRKVQNITQNIFIQDSVITGVVGQVNGEEE